jgi:hypothetical protein
VGQFCRAQAGNFSRAPKEQNFRWDKALAAADAIEEEELSRKFALQK